MIDTLKINFNPDQMMILNMAMAFLMFSVSLDVLPTDFKKVVQFPRSVAAGLIAQYLTFPLLTMVIIRLFQPPVSVAMGMVLVSMCPSGNMTNFLVHFARANVALSVTLNAIIILFSTFTTPAGFLFWSQYIPGSEALRKSLEIRVEDMALIIVQLILLPLLAGMLLNARYTAHLERIRPWVQRIALLLFFAILAFAIIGNLQNIRDYLGVVFLLVLVHNLVGLGNGYATGALLRLPHNDRRTLAFEAGVHNTALGLLLIFKFFNGLGGMAIIAAWWGIWDLVTGMALAAWWRKKSAAAQTDHGANHLLQ